MASSAILKRLVQKSAGTTNHPSHFVRIQRAVVTSANLQHVRGGKNDLSPLLAFGILLGVTSIANVGTHDGKNIMPDTAFGITSTDMNKRDISYPVNNATTTSQIRGAARDEIDDNVTSHNNTIAIDTGNIEEGGFPLDPYQKQTDKQEMDLSPEPHAHWILKKIMEQPEDIAKTLGFGSRLSGRRVQIDGLERNFDRLSKIRHLTLDATKNNLNVARYAEKLMKQFGSFNSVVSSHAGYAYAKNQMSLDPNETGIIVLSQYADNTDVNNLVNTAAKRDVTVMTVGNSSNSSNSDGDKKRISGTKSFATQVTCLALVALWFRQTQDMLHADLLPSTEAVKLEEALMRLPITFGMSKRTQEKCQKIALRMKSKEYCFVFGKGYAGPVAAEGASEMEEISNIHAESYCGGALKHNAFTLINGKRKFFDSVPTILVLLDDCHAREMTKAAEDLKARGAEIIIITDKPSLAHGLDEDPIVIQQNGSLTALGALLPLQLIAYELALLKGIDPDNSRRYA